MILSSDAIRFALLKESLSDFPPRSAAASILLRAMSGDADAEAVRSSVAALTAQSNADIVAEVTALLEKYRLC